jgi:uncharacterized membrane protein
VILKIRIGSGLLPLDLFSGLLAVAIFLFPSHVLRIILGFPFVLFFPGYALLTALYPRQATISGIERIALSFGLSVVVVPLIGLILNYTPLGIGLESVLYSTLAFIVGMSVIAEFRRRRLLPQDRFSLEFYLGMPHPGARRWDTLLSIVLLVAILGALGVVGYAIAMPKEGQRFTEFYLLGLEGKASDYPATLKVGDEGRVLVGVVNHGRDVIEYHVEVRIDGVKNNEVGPIILKQDEKWEKPVSFSPQAAGLRSKVEFFLYKKGDTEPCVPPLRLWLDVTQ